MRRCDRGEATIATIHRGPAPVRGFDRAVDLHHRQGFAVARDRRDDAAGGDLADAHVLRVGDVEVALAIDGDAFGLHSFASSRGAIATERYVRRRPP
jgi:hypothetical protein